MRWSFLLQSVATEPFGATYPSSGSERCHKHFLSRNTDALRILANVQALQIEGRTLVYKFDYNKYVEKLL